MRLLSLSAAAVAAVSGYIFAQSRAVPDEHAGHDAHMPSTAVAFASPQGTAIPAGATTAVQRVNTSPRHGEWVAIKFGASDSVMAWVVFPERSQKAPVVI